MSNTVDNWVFTFGCGQQHEGHYVKISGTFAEARSKMFERFGAEWSFQYSEKEWDEWCANRPSYLPVETELV